MASFKVIAGDFGQGKTGQIFVGRLYRASAQGFSMPSEAHMFKTEHIGTGQIETLETATEENLKKMSGSIGWGMVGGLALGPIGALAGVLAGGRKTEVTFVCQFKDGRKFLGSCDVKTFTAIQAARFEVQIPSKQKTPTNTKETLIHGLIGLLFVIGLILMALFMVKPSPKGVAQANGLNRSAVKLVSYLLIDDINAVLVRGEKPKATFPLESLLGWAQLDWKMTARQYEAAYDDNEISADNDYKGKKILVSGAIASIDKDFMGDASVTLRGSDDFLGVSAHLNEHSMVGAASYTRGEQVNLVCDGGGRIVTVATLDNCEPLTDYLSRISPSIEDKLADFLSGRATWQSPNALPLTTAYVAAFFLPANSPCMNGAMENCRAELSTLFKDQAKFQIIQNRAKLMMTTLKTN